jgi:hypothetical protein
VLDGVRGARGCDLVEECLITRRTRGVATSGANALSARILRFERGFVALRREERARKRRGRQDARDVVVIARGSVVMFDSVVSSSGSEVVFALSGGRTASPTWGATRKCKIERRRRMKH